MVPPPRRSLLTQVQAYLDSLPRPRLAPAANPQAREALRLDAVLEDARGTAGLADFGNEDFLVPLGQLLADVVEELEYTELGLAIFLGDLRRNLVTRLRLAEDLKRHPRILDEDVSDPIVITGMPRSGTTKLQRVLSADPGVHALWTWKVLNPAPFPGQGAGEEDLRITAGRSYADDNSEYKGSHETLAEEAEEDCFLLFNSYDFYGQISFSPSHKYLDWVRRRPRSTAYLHELVLLKYLQWQAGGKNGRRWVLKTPFHIGALDVIADIFPKAIVVNARRGLTEVLPSYCKQIEDIWTRHYSNMTLEFLGWHALHYWAPEYARASDLRARVGDRITILDVPYWQVVADPIGLAEEIHRHAGRTLPQEARDAMATWEAEHVQHRHGKFDVDLARYGLTPAMVRDAFPREVNN